MLDKTQTMKPIKEGNLYNVEDEISGNTNASSTGISKFQFELRKQLINQLRRQNLPNVEEIIRKTFGNTLN